MTYGPPSPYGPHYGPPPVFTPVPPIKPSVGWIVGAWVAAVLIGAGAFVFGLIGVFTTTATSLLGSAPTSTFSSGQTVTVTLDPADGPGIYADAFPMETACEVKGGDVAPVASGSQIAAGNGTFWVREFTLKVPVKGDYRVTCTADDYTGRFGVSQDSAADARESSAANDFYKAVMLAVPVGLLVVAGVVNVLVVVRRGQNRRALGR